MGLLNKLGIGTGGSAGRNVTRQSPTAASGHHRGAGVPPAAVGAPRAPELSETTRVSNGWKEFMSEEEVRIKNAANAVESVDVTPTGRAARFVQANLKYSASSFDAVLL